MNELSKTIHDAYADLLTGIDGVDIAVTPGVDHFVFVTLSGAEQTIQACLPKLPDTGTLLPSFMQTVAGPVKDADEGRQIISIIHLINPL